VSRETPRTYFERLAPEWDRWRAKNRYYHEKVGALIRGMVPPGARVVEIGCGTGDLLKALAPSEGLGLNVAEGLTSRARQRHPTLRFETIEIDQPKIPADFRPDHIVLNNMLDYVYDVWDFMEALRPALTDRTLLIMVTTNPLWAPILRLGSALSLRAPDSPRNFITNRDIRSVLELQGLRVVEEGLALPVPRRVPVLGSLLNAVVPDVPALRYVSSVQYITARLRAPRAPLSCSIVIPCHNEEGNVAECVRRTPSVGHECEVIVVDDGSRDGTRKQAEALLASDPRLRVLAFDRNQGKAKAVEAAFEAARGDVLMILDADMAVAPEELEKFMRPLQEGTADFVNGTRLVYPMEGRAMKIANFFGNKAFCFLVSWILRQRVSDTLCGTKAVLRRDYLRMPRGSGERWGDFNLLFGAGRLRLRILEIPVHYQERKAGASKMKTMREVWRFLRACWIGWRMLRFPDAAPWPTGRPERLAHEIEHHRGLAAGDPADVWGWRTPAGQRRADRRGRLFTRLGKIREGTRVLELGCGTGEFTRRLAETGGSLVALDLSPDLLVRARAAVKASSAHFLQSDAMELPFRDGSFDVVYGCSILHHLDPATALREVRRVLSPGGRLVFSEPNLLNPQVLLMFKCRPLRAYFGTSPDEMAFTRGRIEGVLRGLGFARVSVRYFDFLHPSTPRSLLRLAEPAAEMLERIPLVRAISGSLLIHAEL
jgi:ubiquinone/menaquinone biosynthesis C-methylase UbiE